MYHFITLQDETMLYSEFKQHLHAGRVLRVFIGEKTLSGELKQLNPDQEPLTFTTLKIEDPDLVKILEAQKNRIFGQRHAFLACKFFELGAAACVDCVHRTHDYWTHWPGEQHYVVWEKSGSLL